MNWLNGWTSTGDHVLIGNGKHCICCGRCFAIVTLTPGPDDPEPLSRLPDWPFSQDDCPLCRREYRALTVDDLAKLPLATLRQAVLRKRGMMDNLKQGQPTGVSSYFNFKTGDFDWLPTPPDDWHDYISQDVSAQGLYDCYIGEGLKPAEAAKRVLRLIAGLPGTD